MPKAHDDAVPAVSGGAQSLTPGDHHPLHAPDPLTGSSPGDLPAPHGSGSSSGELAAPHLPGSSPGDERAAHPPDASPGPSRLPSRLAARANAHRPGPSGAAAEPEDRALRPAGGQDGGAPRMTGTPGDGAPRRSGARATGPDGSGASGARMSGRDDPRTSEQRETEQGGADAGAAEPRAGSVGRIPGLRPRRRPGDGGEVAGADVDFVDGLAAPTRRTVVAWLTEKPSKATRQARLQVLAAFLRWLQDAEPALDPLAATGAHLDAYCNGALSGTLTVGVRTPGRPLSPATVSRKRAMLSAFYTFAWQRGAVRPGPIPALTPGDRRLLRKGVARLAAEGKPAEAAAVALLDATGAPVSSLAGITLQDLRAVTAGEPAIVTVPDGRGDLVAFPVPPVARPLLRTLSSSRTPGEPLIRQQDGHPVDVQWVKAALTEAALAGGIPRRRAEALDPYMMQAPTVSDLLRTHAPR